MVAVRSGRGVQDSSPEQLAGVDRSEEHTSELQSQSNIVCRLLLEKKKNRYVPFSLTTLIHGILALSNDSTKSSVPSIYIKTSTRHSSPTASARWLTIPPHEVSFTR